MAINFYPNFLQQNPNKKVSFTGISGSIVKEYENIDKLNLDLINKAAGETKHNYFVRLMLEKFRENGIVDTLGKIIINPTKITVNKAIKSKRGKFAFPFLEKIKILLKGGMIKDEKVNSLNVQNGIARNITTKDFEATGGKLCGINIIGNNKLSISGFAHIRNLKANESHDIELGNHSILNNGEFQKEYSLLSIRDHAIAKDINKNIDFEKYYGGNLVKIENHGTLNGYKGFKIKAKDSSHIRNFEVKNLSIDSDFNGIVRRGTTDTMAVGNGYVTKMNAKNANIFGKTFFTNSNIEKLNAIEDARLKNIACKEAVIADNAKIINSNIEDTLVIKDNATVIGGQVKNLVVYGNNTNIKGLKVTGKITQITYEKGDDGQMHEIKQNISQNLLKTLNGCHLK